MTALPNWASTDVRPQFRVVPLNLVEEDLAAQDEWDQTLAKLKRWLDDPGALEDDCVDAPSRETVQLACVLAAQARKQGMPPPTRVMPNGEAGVALEWVVGQSRNLWEIDDRQRLEMARFEGTRCASRTHFDLAGLSL
jgi:hypothetical protein